MKCYALEDSKRHLRLPIDAGEVFSQMFLRCYLER